MLTKEQIRMIAIQEATKVAQAIYDVYSHAIADGYMHFRISDGKHLTNAGEIMEAIAQEGQVAIRVPWAEEIQRFIKKVRF